ncbi:MULTISPECIES: N-acetylmuramate alpha-1-phosphate uridylyltransferase MurU [unclassified Neptuniibacter]|uniref:N-acetylmuramate alpha-1-phosphate uridylyltransferase MurU n=1 Tax=unclassified Neptuniibacter TaxID=2630693 RepID=UPI0026E236BC|nr:MULTISPECIES: nucleotidyltransferase family protein [unclassified Neptuniibacter]MDO6512989.1 nucleotidyltransferase family protein [Neptuniibacter sp. 2_MG-2023]MDO6592806.1 nucleotidyltransferase family protein [Neptuniibacter sp. 1_MG-2023]
MKAMILAAGIGKRMRPLTLTTPKPLLEIAGVPLIEYHVRRLVAAGFSDIVVNHAWLGDQIEAYLGDGRRFGANIVFSREVDPLETAGGIRKALPLLVSEGETSFILVNGDVFTDFPYSSLNKWVDKSPYLVLVPNPPHNPEGDFCLNNGRLYADRGEKYTFSGVSVLPLEMFADLVEGEAAALGPLLREAIAKGKVYGAVYDGFWADIGTPERLRQIDDLVKEQK